MVHAKRSIDKVHGRTNSRQYRLSQTMHDEAQTIQRPALTHQSDLHASVFFEKAWALLVCTRLKTQNLHDALFQLNRQVVGLYWPLHELYKNKKTCLQLAGAKHATTTDDFAVSPAPSALHMPSHDCMKDERLSNRYHTENCERANTGWQTAKIRTQQFLATK